MLDPHTRPDCARVTRDARTVLARLGAEPHADSGNMRVAAPPDSSVLKIQGSPGLPLGLALAAAAGVAALLIACVSEVPQLVFALGAVAAASMGALLAVLTYAKDNDIHTQDVVNVISDLERLVGTLIGTVESQPTDATSRA